MMSTGVSVASEHDRVDKEHSERLSDARPGPTLEFSGRVPYDTYVHASTLHTLQRTYSSDPGEMAFLMISQVMELYFGLMRHEMRHAMACLSDDDVWAALQPLRRMTMHMEALNGAWHGLRWMTPSDFNRFRELLGEGSGFQSAMYRQIEFLLGLKTPSMVRPFRHDDTVHREMLEALHAPSLYDAVLAALARAGHAVPADRVDRDFSVDPEISPEVEAVWVAVYADDRPQNPWLQLAETLVDIGEHFQDWRYRHLMAVHRTMGAKSGSGGSAGLTWLQRGMARMVFPELWSARTVM